MARFRGMKSPIMSVKHYVHQTLLTVTSGTIRNVELAATVVAPATGASNQVQEGSVVKALWVEMWFINIGAAGSTTSFNLTIEKRPSSAAAMTFTNSTNLGSYLNKKNILYVTQGNIGATVVGSGAMPMFRQLIMIPKGKQRMGLGDDIVLNVNSVGADGQICGITTYKEYR